MKKLCLLLLMILLSYPAHAGDREVLQQVYELALENYIDEVNLSDIAGPALRALGKLDKNVRIAFGSKAAAVYIKGKLLRVYPRPNEEQDALKWAKFTERVIEGAKEVSPLLRHKDFELVELMLSEAMPQFDKNARYYPMLDLGQEKEKLQPYVSSIRDGNILYIRLGTINDLTIDNFYETVKEHMDVKGIILDLRGNSGGYLKQALDITDSFLDQGMMIYTIGKDKGKRKIYRSDDAQYYSNTPMIVLVDSGTASAAEVIALVLKEKGRAKILGAQTYGKGTVQNIYKLVNDAHLSLTTEHFYSARHTDIDENGIRPNICTVPLKIDFGSQKVSKQAQEHMCKRAARPEEDDLLAALKQLQSAN